LKTSNIHFCELLMSKYQPPVHHSADEESGGNGDSIVSQGLS
jgi:hypothetical protein